MWRAPCRHRPLPQAGRQYSKVGHLSSLETLRHWTEGTGLTRATRKAAATEPSVCGGCRGPQPGARAGLAPSGASAEKGHRPSRAPCGSLGGAQLWSRAVPRKRLEEGQDLACPQEQQGLAPPAASGAFRSANPLLSYLLWPEGPSAGPMTTRWTCQAPRALTPTAAFPAAHPPPPAARQLGLQGLWGRFHRKGLALCGGLVFSVKPPAPSANPCVLLSPEQNVNRHLKAKGIEYLFYP